MIKGFQTSWRRTQGVAADVSVRLQEKRAAVKAEAIRAARSLPDRTRPGGGSRVARRTLYLEPE